MKAVRQGRGMARLLMLLALAGCSSRSAEPPPPSPGEIRAKIVCLMPTTAHNRQGRASDIYTAFSTRQIYPSDENLCTMLAVTEQESTYQVDPPAAGLGRIAAHEVERRAGELHVSVFLISSALNIKPPDDRIYNQRLAAARTEEELSGTFDDFIAIIPMGGRLFGGFNPVHTGGPMQISTAFAEQHADGCPYPLDGSICREVFNRRGDVYFGTAHLLDYPADYPAPLYRFADFNASWYASRNAAFWSVVSRASGIPLTLDGDLIRYGTCTPDSTELVVRSLGKRLDISNAAIRRALERGDSPEFADNALYRKVFALAESVTGKTLSRAVLPGIALESPKIIRKLTTAWFAKRVNRRYQRCMTRVRKR